METLVEFLSASIRLTAPLLLAALGGSFMQLAGVPNIAMEGTMLISALIAYIVSFTTGSWALGLVFGILAALIVGALYALLVLRFKADNFAVGITLNILFTGITAYIIRRYYNTDSTLLSPNASLFPKISFAIFKGNATLDSLLNGYSLLIPISLILVLLTWLILYKTPFGFWVRAAGFNPSALAASGKSVNRIQLWAFLISAAFCGLAGAHLSLGYLGLFSLSVVSGRGFVALAIVLFGGGNPGIVLLSSFIFGAANAASMRIPTQIVAPQIPLMLPYIITIIAITVMSSIAKSKSARD